MIDVSAVLSAELTSVGESSMRNEAGSKQLLFKHQPAVFENHTSPLCRNGLSIEPGCGCKYGLSGACGSSEVIFSSFHRWESEGVEEHWLYPQESAWQWSPKVGSETHRFGQKKKLYGVKGSLFPEKIMPSIKKADWDCLVK